MTLGALTLTITLPRSSAARTAATLKLDGIASPLGMIVVVIDGVVALVAGVVTFGVVGVVAVNGTLAVVILGVDGNEGTEVEGLEVVNDGLDIVLTLGRIGMAL
jgi:hypothetical protein